MLEAKVEEGKRRAAEVRAAMTEEMRQRVDALVAQVPVLLAYSYWDTTEPYAHKHTMYTFLPDGMEDHRVGLYENKEV